MPTTFAPHASKVRLREVSTGTVIERWPVDARELLAGSAYVIADEPAPDETETAPAAPVDPVPHVTQAAAQNAMQSPTGAPLVVAPASGVTAAAPMQLPAGREAKRGK